jgi:beta-galactosidase
VAPAASRGGFTTELRWSLEGSSLRLQFTATPDGEWPFPLPRIGLRLALPASLANVGWFGLGPGESYPDSRRAARVSRYRSSLDDLQTPYVYPQENGHRSDVRWVEFDDGTGRGIRIEGSPWFGFAARPWTTEQLDAACHPSELSPSGRVWVSLDSAVHGLGSASCGPGVLPQYQLRAALTRTDYRFVLLD